MRLARYQPAFAELPGTRLDIPTRMQQLLSEVWGGSRGELGWAPQIDVVETERELVLRADLPGLTAEQVQLEVTDGTLVIKGEREEKRESKGAEYRLAERAWGSFERCLALPTSVDADAISAEFTNGVLEVHLPKTEKAVGRRVPIGKG